MVKAEAPLLPKHRLAATLSYLVSGIGMGEPGDKAKDILGRVYEYFLGGFAGSEGKRGGEFYTPRSVVRVLVEMLSERHPASPNVPLLSPDQ
jgi:type I restriction enzyme M protein